MDLGGGRTTDTSADGPLSARTEGRVSTSPHLLSDWENYYRTAARRRRAGGGRRHLREEKRRRRIRERLGLGISALLVGGLTMIFYLLLTR